MYSRNARLTRDHGARRTQTKARGYEVLRDPALNKGTAFTLEERTALGLHGLRPPAVTTDLEPQLERAYAAYHAAPTDLVKHVSRWALHNESVVLFYALLQRHMLEVLPVVYDPVVGEAIEAYSEVASRPRGVFLSIDDPGSVEDRLAAFGAGPDDIDLLVATDSEEILGIGDWGAGGIDISIGKLAVYTAAAGIDPHRVIPVVLDVGTDNEKLLNDPLYIGYCHARVRGQAYDDFIDAYVRAATKLFPNTMLHWEDFDSTNCRRILDHYRDAVATCNDDMQGTGAIVMSGLFNALTVAGTAWRDQRVVVLGGGTAGCGIADQIRDQMVRDDEVADLTRTPCAPDPKAATRWPAMAALRDAAANCDGIIDLATVVAATQPTILIGTSTTPGMFTEEIVRTMATSVERPIIFPLSNPTELHEATPEHLNEWWPVYVPVKAT